MISPFERWYRLVPRGGAGLVCDESGIALGAVDLAPAHRDAGGRYHCEVRSEPEVGRVLTLAYGPQPDAIVARLQRGLRRAAGWIEAGDLCLASLETVMLRLPDLTAEGMAKLAEAANLEKGGTAWQDQPRRPGGESGGGQWTSGDGGSTAAPEEAVREGRSVALDDGVYQPDVDRPAITPVATGRPPPRGSNRPPPDYTTLKHIFSNYEAPGVSAILVPMDGVLGISGLADEANAEATAAVYRSLMAEIKEVDPKFVDAELMPEGGIAGLSWEERNSLIDHLLMARASAYYRVRGDAGRLQVETLRFLGKRVDAAYDDALKLFDAGQLEPKLSREEAIGNYIDGRVRQELRAFFGWHKVPYGAKQDISINSRDYSTAESLERSYRIPDARVGKVVFDWTLTKKANPIRKFEVSSRQILNLLQSSLSVRPSYKGTANI